MPDVSERVVRAADGIIRRTVEGRDEVAVVHRSRYDDWTLPKGELRPEEDWEEAELREGTEETGCELTLGDFAGAVS